MDNKDIISPDKLVQKILTHKQLYVAELESIQKILKLNHIELPLEQGSIIMEKTQIVFYSAFKATSRKETDIMSTFQSMDIVQNDGIHGSPMFKVQKISNQDIWIKFTRMQGKFSCEISSISGHFFKLITQLLQCIFTYSEYVREGKHSKAKNNTTGQDIMTFDPNLFQHVRDPDDTYPRTCAAQRKPEIINKKQYDDLLKNPKTKDSIGIMTHTTTKTDYFISCAHHPETPYFYQITGKQADDRCFPCCKKKAPSEITKFKIKTCYNTGFFIENKREKHGKYVIRNYNQIKNERLADLPQKLTFLLKDKTYIYGVEQTISEHNVGMFYSCVVITGLDTFDFLRKSEEFYMKRKGTSLSENRQFMASIINFFSNIETENIVQHNNNIDVYMQDLLYIMPYVFGIDLMIISIEGDITTLSLSLVNKGIILNVDNLYYPVIKVNPVKFYASQDLDKEIQLQKKKKPRYFNISQLKLNKTHYLKLYSHDNMYYIFTIEDTYQIERIYVNADENCYGMLLQKQGSTIYVPFEMEPLSYLKEQYKSVSFEGGAFNPSQYTLDNKVIQKLSNTLAEQLTNSQSLKYNQNLQKIIYKNDLVVAFTQLDLLFYCQPVHLSTLNLPRNIQTQTINISYDMYKMNQILYEMRKKEKDGIQFSVLDDPKQQLTLKQGLLIQSEYFAIKFNIIDQLKNAGKNPGSFTQLTLKQIEETLNNILKYQIEPYDTEKYDNIIVSCYQNNQQAYCKGNILIVSNEEILKKYLSVLAYEIYKSPTAVFESSKQGMIMDQLEFNPTRGYVTFYELSE